MSDPLKKGDVRGDGYVFLIYFRKNGVLKERWLSPPAYERAIASVKRWRINNPEKSRKNSRAYYALNRDRVTERQRRWRLQNVDRIRTTDAIYRLDKRKTLQKNGGSVDVDSLLGLRISGAKSRAKKSGDLYDLDHPFIKSLWESQNGLCALTHLPMTSIQTLGRIPTNVSIDRIDPHKGYTKGNVRLVCMAVNQMKSDLSDADLRLWCSYILHSEKPFEIAA